MIDKDTLATLTDFIPSAGQLESMSARKRRVLQMLTARIATKCLDALKGSLHYDDSYKNVQTQLGKLSMGGH
jgi:hypothetical protein